MPACRPWARPSPPLRPGHRCRCRRRPCRRPDRCRRHRPPRARRPRPGCRCRRVPGRPDCRLPLPSPRTRPAPG
ncbi:hypothetical protein F1189_06480 [Rhodovastum atsumiense]|uniref:Uncharacterized protein n=1 Tax=Rhodovastum atsumiense TaxID=504468 RepID=A0A5M6IXS0_9PROT|nr:hypothetical protein F1189_06480 [Rhodovastum atsumiense]